MFYFLDRKWEFFQRSGSSNALGLRDWATWGDGISQWLFSDNVFPADYLGRDGGDHGLGFFGADDPGEQGYGGTKERLPPPGTMGIAGQQVDIALFHQGTAQVSNPAAEKSGQAGGGELGQAAEVKETGQFFRPLLNDHMAFRVGDDGREASGLQGIADIFGGRWQGGIGKFQQEIASAVIDGDHLVLIKQIQTFLTQGKITAGEDL